MKRRRTAAAAAILAVGSLAGLLTRVAPVGAATVKATVVQKIDASDFDPPSSDTAGITYLPSSGRLLLADCEIDEMSFFHGVNLWEMSPSGSVARTGSTTAYSKEPTGLSFDPRDGTLYVTDDNNFAVYMVKAGSDGRFGNSDDSSTSFGTKRFGSSDPEGVAIDTDTGDLFIADGAGHQVFHLKRGSDGKFGGSDDVITHFDMGRYGLADAEGIGYDSDRHSLVVIDTRSKTLYEVETDGSLIRTIDISAASPKGGGDVAVAPASRGSGNSYWVVLRGENNEGNPTENDGKVYELSVGTSPTPTPTPSPTPGGTQADTTLVADATIKQATPNGNFGTAQTLEVDHSPVQDFLLKFQVSGIGSKSVTGVKLRLVNKDKSSKGGDIRPFASTSWVESGSGGVTWNSVPAPQEPVLASLGKVAVGNAYEIALPTSAISGDGFVSFRVTSTSSDGADWWSKEKGGGLAPQLLVTVED